MYPSHVAIIMDGNGRWALKKGLPRIAGHKAGVNTLKNIVKKSSELKIQFLTLFAFSSENWNRPDSEISDLMELLKLYLNNEAKQLLKNDVKLVVIGRRDRIETSIIEKINSLEDKSKNNKGLNLVIALDYGGREDIRQAFIKILKNYNNKSDISLELISKNLMTKNIPDPDLIIRTSGEYRISNFLLWQSAYSEYIFVKCYWPEFNDNEYLKALEEFKSRERRFGSLNE